MPKTTQKLMLLDGAVLTIRTGGCPPENTKVRKHKRWEGLLEKLDDLHMIGESSPWMEISGFNDVKELAKCKNTIHQAHFNAKLKKTKFYRFRMAGSSNDNGSLSLWLRKERIKNKRK